MLATLFLYASGNWTLDDEILQILARKPTTDFPQERQREGIMNGIRPKIPRVLLDPVAYKNLRQEVLRRDCWRCQSCGTMSNLEVHHRELHSHLGMILSET